MKSSFFQGESHHIRPPATKNFRSRFTVVGMASLETLRQRDQRDINIARNVVKINLLVCH